jgi:hypothetical protein
MRPKDKNIMKGFDRKGAKLAALSYYTSTLFRHDISSSQQNTHAPSGASSRYFE